MEDKPQYVGPVKKSTEILFNYTSVQDEICKILAPTMSEKSKVFVKTGW